MKGLTWNCRGLKNALAPTIPKIRALLSSTYYDFVFLVETKCSVSSIGPLFRPFGFSNNLGIDANGSAGGLWVGWRNEARISHVLSCNNFIVLLVEKCQGRLWYLVLIYGSPYCLQRRPVLQELEDCLQKLVYPFLIVGDFNQVEYQSDKLSSSNRTITGAYDFNIWRITNQMVDIPFKGPRYTWCNNQKRKKRVYERIDRALGSKDWLSVFPNTGIKHYPIQISDHAPIELDLQLIKNNKQKPYKLDAWVLEYEESINIIKDIWRHQIWGTPSFRVARKLSRVRHRVKKWALDKRMEWKQKWDDFDNTLEKGIEIAINDGSDELYTKTNEEVREFSKASAVFWKQRAKLKWMVDGDTCTKYFFNWVKVRVEITS
ncbi:uncharacterized protein LOC141648737 [Silene latifolia]|uniref:uncharacterized protein LOC141648737 n=1 Tax=Silene latifolia TaxID=37657 RepID=UPI003D784F56